MRIKVRTRMCYFFLQGLRTFNRSSLTLFFISHSKKKSNKLKSYWKILPFPKQHPTTNYADIFITLAESKPFALNTHLHSPTYPNASVRHPPTPPSASALQSNAFSSSCNSSWGKSQKGRSSSQKTWWEN